MNKHGRVVVLKYMFTQQELEEDKSLLLDLKEDVREECETLGEVTNVVLYDVCPTISTLVGLLRKLTDLSDRRNQKES